MSEPAVVAVSKELYETLKPCRSCANYNSTTTAGYTCTHSANTTGEIDLITGAPIYTHSIQRMRTTVCGIQGRLYLSKEAATAIFNMTHRKKTLNRKLTEEDI